MLNKTIHILAAIIFSINSFSQVSINEFQARNASTLINTTFYNFEDWVEIFNYTDTTVNLSGYKVTDDIMDIQKWTIPSGTTIAPNSFLLFWLDGENQGLHTNFQLDGDGECIALLDPAGGLIDVVFFDEQYPDISYGRKPDATGDWYYFSEATPGDSNLTQNYNATFSTEPVFSIHGGFYDQNCTVALSTSTPAEIRYTIDGSLPDKDALVYTDSIAIDSNTIIRAKAFEPGKLPSKTITHSYLISEHDSELPVVSIGMDPPYLWDDTIGIYVEGVNGIPGGGTSDPHNWNQNWERPVNIEYFAASDTLVFNQMAGVEIFGNYSRREDQKSFTLEFKKKYWQNKVRQQLFKEKNIDEFASLILRNSGNDCRGTHLRDAVTQRIAAHKFDIDYQAYQPVAVYINGTYWGILNLRERYDETYTETNHDANPDSVDILALWETKVGSKDNYYGMIWFLDNKDVTDLANYQQLENMIDIQELINYCITEMYYRNHDWPMKNHKCWRPQSPDGQWRWMIYDLDITTGIWDMNPAANSINYLFNDPTPGSNSLYASYVLRKLMANDTCHDLFIRSAVKHINTAFNPARTDKIIDSAKNNIENEMVYHINRWGGNINSWNNDIQEMKDWLKIRPEYFMQHLADHFSLGGQINFRLTSNMPEAGFFKFEHEPVFSDTLSGVLSTGYLTDIQAISYHGYTFKEWVINGFINDTVLNIISGDQWKYLDDGTDQGISWRTNGFNDNTWQNGITQMGYGDGDEQTILDYGAVNNKHITYYFRKKFIIPNAIMIDKINARLISDDGAIVYLNGNEIYRTNNMPWGPISYSTTARWAVNRDKEQEFFNFSIDTALLMNDTNIIAIEIHQVDSLDDDVSFDFELFAIHHDPLQEEIIRGNRLQEYLKGNVTLKAIYETKAFNPLIKINEIMASNTIIPDEYGETDDWIELYNTSDSAIDIGGLYVSDETENPKKWQIPANTTMQPHGFILLWADGQPEQGMLHMNFKLNIEGETVSLFCDDGISYGFIDTLTYEYFFANKTIGRYKDGDTGIFELAIPTPGDTNILELNIMPGPLTENTDIIIYPNPAQDIINIVNIKQYIQLDIVDMTNRMIRKVQINGRQSIAVDVSALHSGIYICRLRDGANNIQTRKILIQ